jgi:predicted MPP superfamily phosphohydrolase
MPITWLHLSDLHACPRDGWESAEITSKLVDDLKRLAETRQLVPDLIFFTGDAAWGNLPGKLPIAAQFELRFPAIADQKSPRTGRCSIRSSIS